MSIVTSPAPDSPSDPGLTASHHREPPTLACVSRELDAGLLIVNVAAMVLRAAAEPLARIGTALAGSDGNGADAQDASAARLRLRELCASADVNGINLLYADSRLHADADRVALVSAVARDMDGCLTIKSIDIDRRTIALFDVAPDNASPCGLLDRIDEATGVSLMSVDLTAARTRDPLDDRLIRQVRLAQIGLAAAASRLSIVQSRISLQSSFIASLSKAGDTEPNALIDDTLSADATRKTALATQRLLHAQTHSIANTNRQTVLTLFKGD